MLEVDEVKMQLEKLFEQGVIRPSTSPCRSPIIIVPMKDGTWQIRIDYKAINRITLKNKFPLPRVDDLLDPLQHAKYFTILYLKSGSH